VGRRAVSAIEMAAAGVFEVCGKRGIGLGGVAQVVSSSQSQFVSPQPSSYFLKGGLKESRRGSRYGAGRARAVATRDPPRTTANGAANGSTNGAANGAANGAPRSMVSLLVIQAKDGL
jgi:hypothetical protein